MQKLKCLKCDYESAQDGKCPSCGEDLWPVVFSYTDEDAVRDGVLVNVSGLLPYPFNRVTRAIWDTYTEPIGKLPSGLGHSPVTNTTKLSELGELVNRKLKANELTEGWVVMEFGGRKIWAMPNETVYSSVRQVPGWTIMFPEDY